MEERTNITKQGLIGLPHTPINFPPLHSAQKFGGGKLSGGENFRLAVPFARKVGWGWDHEISVGRRGGEGQNFLRLRRASSYCVTPYSRTTHAHVHTQTHTRLFFASAHRKDCNNKDTNHRSAMHVFLLHFGLLFRPGASWCEKKPCVCLCVRVCVCGTGIGYDTIRRRTPQAKKNMEDVLKICKIY